MNQLIINTELFLQCYGNCSGCFLTQEERVSTNTQFELIKSGLSQLAQQYKEVHIKKLVIGFGRGNLLNFSLDQLNQLSELITWCEKSFTYEDITFEISTSLIGKIEQQIANAKYLLSTSKNIFFNIVINSEITSKSFWNNFQQFYNYTAEIRKGWGWLEDWGDILVLNVNPQKLPDLEWIKEISENHKSPININLFPFEHAQKIILNSEIVSVNEWVNNLWDILDGKDFNMKNYLEQLHSIDFDLNPTDLQHYYVHTEKSYIFIDKLGTITKGISSIMGEVDFPRLIEKYSLDPNMLFAYRKMQRTLACMDCNYQKECLVSGAFLNYLSNTDKIKDKSVCASGYQTVFMKSKK